MNIASDPTSATQVLNVSKYFTYCKKSNLAFLVIDACEDLHVQQRYPDLPDGYSGKMVVLAMILWGYLFQTQTPLID